MNEIAPAFGRAAAGAFKAQSVTAAPRGTVWVRDDRYFMPIAAMIWVVMALVILPEGLDYSLLAIEVQTLPEAVPHTGGTVVRLLWLALLSGALFVLARRITFAWLLTQRLNAFLLLFVLMAAASITWSIDPAVTLRRMVRILTVVFLAMAFVLMGWHVRRFQNVLRPMITLVLLGSIIFALAWPAYGIHQDLTLAGAWRGLTSHKNSLGDLASIALILWFHAWLSSESRPWRTLVGGVLAVTCLLLSRSSTALVATFFAMLFLALMLRLPASLRRYLPHLLWVFILMLLGYALVMLNILPGLDVLMSPVSMLTGKDLTLTSRTDIWSVFLEHVRLHPFLGTGYGAYWTGAVEGAPSNVFMQRLQFYPGSAHSGYLEILNDLGAIGLLVLFGYLASFVVQSLRLLSTERIQAALFLALFLQQVITNLSESRWLNALSVDFVIMTLATCALARISLDLHLRRVLGEPRPMVSPFVIPPRTAATRIASP